MGSRNVIQCVCRHGKEKESWGGLGLRSGEEKREQNWDMEE